MNSDYKYIGIIGAGGWGTALSLLLHDNSHQVKIWAYEKHVVEEINAYHTNNTFLPGIQIHQSVTSTENVNELAECEYLVLAIPTQFIRSICANNSELFKGKKIINVAKGIEKRTLFRISEILQDVISISYENYTVLTGPSHAEEVARRTPTTLVAASENPIMAKEIQEIFSNSYLRVYSSDDVIGCEIGGSLKNVVAIAAGIIDGLSLGDNTKAALITRGLAEISRLGVALGANSMTFSGLSGLGDLIVTCNSKHSRNRSVGEQIGKGKTLEQVIIDMEMIAEGVATTESAYSLGKKHNVEIPITEQVYDIFFKNTRPIDAIKNLMTRQSKREWWW